MNGILLILLEILAFLYSIVAIIIFVWSLLPASKELPEEAETSWSESLVAAILWPVTIWICISSFAKSL